MRNFYLSFLAFLLIGGLGKASAQGGANIVNRYGRLQVKNAHVCAENGTQISLGGMSMFWSGWSSKYYTAATVNYLVDNLKTSVVRAAYGVPEATGPQNDIQDIKNVVETAIARGVYVIIDWHIEGNNSSYEAQEIAFFESMVQQYGSNNNVIYELWNEPTSSSTSTIQGVCQRVANAIRAKEIQLGYSHKLVICGSNTWSQYPNSYSIDDPNAAYTFHGYFDNQPSHLTQLYTNAKAAMDMGNAVFVTEYGANFCSATNTSSAIQWCQDHGISMCAWSVNDKVEAWSIFTNNMDGLTCVGNFYKSKLTAWTTPVMTKVYPTSVSIAPATATIPTIGGTTTLIESFLPANTTETTVTWSSSNNAVATVSTRGVVTGVAVGEATITATSKDENGGDITGSSTVTVQNLINVALNKTATVSSVETVTTGSVIGSNAVDGNASTRWSSTASDPQTLQVDLGISYAIKNVSINWEVASAKDYTIQISDNGTAWTTIATQTNMVAGARVDNLSISGTCRYIKVNGTARTSIYGFSIYEFAVYGTPAATLSSNFLPANSTDLLMNPNAKTDSLKVYPNPVNSNVIIDISGSDFQSQEDLMVQIYNLLGQVVYYKQISANQTGKLNLQIVSTDNLKSGTYIIKIKGSVVKQAKLIIN